MISFLLNLPTELLNHIVWYLDLTDLQSCQLVHPLLHSAVKDSLILKYLTALKASGMEDDRLYVPNSTAERLDLLRQHEAGWSRLRFDFQHTMPVKPSLSWPVRLDGGVLFLLDTRQMNFHYINLPSRGSDTPEWERLHCDCKVMGFGLAVDEHDLIAIATISRGGRASTNDEIEVLLLQVSTALPHPLAQKSRIMIASTTYRSCTVSIKVSGESLVVLVNDFAKASEDKVFVYEWMSGVLRVTISAPHHSYNSILFLSLDKILLPNREAKTLDVWDISGPVETVPRTRPDTILGFLPFREDTILMGLTCWSAPSPAMRGALHSKRPFRESSIDAIVYFRAHVQSFHTTPLEEAIFLSIFVRRRALLDLCVNDVGVNHIPWHAWGPPVVRLLATDVIAPQWLTATAGERYVALSGNSEIIVLDFNTDRAQALEAERGSGSSTSMSKDESEDNLYTRIEKGVSRFDHGSLREPVHTELPYAYYKRGNMGTFDSVLMDGERILGLKTGNHGQTISEIRVMRLGWD